MGVVGETIGGSELLVKVTHVFRIQLRLVVPRAVFMCFSKRLVSQKNLAHYHERGFVKK